MHDAAAAAVVPPGNRTRAVRTQRRPRPRPHLPFSPPPSCRPAGAAIPSRLASAAAALGSAGRQGARQRGGRRAVCSSCCWVCCVQLPLPPHHAATAAERDVAEQLHRLAHSRPPGGARGRAHSGGSWMMATVAAGGCLASGPVLLQWRCLMQMSLGRDLGRRIGRLGAASPARCEMMKAKVLRARFCACCIARLFASRSRKR